MKFGVVVFPGSNSDHDAYHAATDVMGQDAAFIWHKDTTLQGADVVILPGGFAHGDYLRTGAIARFSPIMPAILELARGGGPVLGICNGFQVLLEAGLLPGAMLRNRDVRVHCGQVFVRVEQADTPVTLRATKGQRLRLPVAHGGGNYYAAPEVGRQPGAARRGGSPGGGARGGGAGGWDGSCLGPRGRRRGRCFPPGGAPLPSKPLSFSCPKTADDRHPRGIRPDRLPPEARAHGNRARHLLRHVVRALQLQELA